MSVQPWAIIMSKHDTVISDIMQPIRLKMSNIGIPLPLCEYIQRCRVYINIPLICINKASAMIKWGESYLS